MPQTLRDKEAKQEWNRVTKLLAGVGVITAIDVKTLALYCDCWSLYREAMKKIGKDGIVQPTQNGYPAQSPYVGVLHKARADMLKLLQEMGMTPASRTKVSVVQGSKDDFDDFLTSTNAS